MTGRADDGTTAVLGAGLSSGGGVGGAGGAGSTGSTGTGGGSGGGVRLLWNPDNVKDVAESVGIAQLGEDALRCLSQDVEFRIGQVLVEALRCMRAARRTTLTVQDVALALRVLDVEPLYGYESTRPLRYGEASLGSGQSLFYVEDEEVDFERLINAPLPKVPRDTSLTAHWLAIEGVQPAIPQNPTTAEARGTQDLVAKGPGAHQALGTLAGSSEQVGFRPAVKHILSNELVLYFDKIQAAVLDDNPDGEVLRLRAAALASVRADPGLHQLVPYFVSFIATQVTHRVDDVAVLRRMLELTTALVENPHVFLDPYVTPLCAPILTCLLGHTLGGGGGGGDSVHGADGDEGRTEGASAGSDGHTGNFYALREMAASLLGLLARRFARTNTLLRPKLTRTCLKTLLVSSSSTGGAASSSHSNAGNGNGNTPTMAMDHPYRPAGVLFGAVAGLSAAGGPEAVRVLLLPNLKTLDTYVLQPLQERARAGGQNSVAAVDFEMLVAGGLLKAIRTLAPVADAATTAAITTDGTASDMEMAELVDFLGPIVGGRVAQMGDRRLNEVILEARNIE